MPPDRTRALLGAGVIAVVVAMMFWTNREVQKPLPPIARAPRTLTPEQIPPARAAAPDAQVVASKVPPAPSNVASAAPPPPAIPTQPASAVRAGDVIAELEEVQGALAAFRTAIGENPVGTNAEITRELLGNNLKQLKLPLPPGSQVNAEGELCDRWGTPYFFHQVSGQQMEVRTAGQDRQMWTGDDQQM